MTSHVVGERSLTAVDLFSGAGGATCGLRSAGFEVVAAVEKDRDAAETYRLNHPATLLVEADIEETDAEDLRRRLKLRPGQLTLLKSCPPCQSFSSLHKGKSDDLRSNLILDTLRFVDSFDPRTILLENVPGLGKDSRFETLRLELERRGYWFESYTVRAESLGVPQRRRRLIVLAIHGDFSPPPTEFARLVPVVMRRPQMTAGDALRLLDTAMPREDPWHRWRKSSPRVVERISAVPASGTRFDLPDHLALDCHSLVSRATGRPVRNATASYGRVRA